MNKEKEIEAELNYYAQLKKGMKEKLEEMRREFPDVPAEKVLNKYRTDKRA